jgi:hypothetical protein
MPVRAQESKETEVPGTAIEGETEQEIKPSLEGQPEQRAIRTEPEPTFREDFGPAKWMQHLSVEASQLNGAYSDTQKNHVTQETGVIDGLPLKGKKMGLFILNERSPSDGFHDAWLLQGTFTSWTPKSEYWLGSFVAEAEGGFSLTPPSGPKSITIGLHYQKNTYKETDELWSKVKLEDQLLIMLGTRLRQTIFALGEDFSAYLSGNIHGFFSGSSANGYKGEGSLGLSQIIFSDLRLDVAYGFSLQKISGTAATPYQEPLTIDFKILATKLECSIWF